MSERPTDRVFEQEPLDPLSAATPAFIVGVTGHMDLRRDEEERLREEVRRLFRFLKKGVQGKRGGRERLEALVGSLPPVHSGRNPYRESLDQWIGLEHTPIVILTSLAPGADALVAEVALEKEFQEDGFRVRAPLPAPHDLYANWTTFRRHGRDSRDAGDEARVAKYEDLLARIRPENTFPVELMDDLGEPADRRRDLYERDRDDEQARNRRYRAAGEFIAGSAHLLLAIWDEESDRDATSGTAAIVEARRRYLTPDLLPTPGSVALSDNGPLLHLRTRTSDAPAGPPVGALLRFLHPYGSAPLFEDDPSDLLPKDDDSVWQQNRLELFCRIGANLDDFNRTAHPAAASVDDELRDRLSYREPRTGRDVDARGLFHETAPEYVHELHRLARLHVRAGEANRLHARRNKRTLVWLFWLTFFAAASLHLFAHWYVHGTKEEDGHSGTAASGTTTGGGSEDAAAAGKGDGGRGHDPKKSWPLMRKILGGVAVAFGLAGLLVFALRRPKRYGERAHDSRAIAEGLRVQMAWAVAGVRRSVPSNYMQRQRSELDWICSAIHSIAFPYGRWRARSDALGRRDRIRALRCVLRGWIEDQFRYFRKRGTEWLRWMHFWHESGSVLALAAIWVFLSMCLCHWCGWSLAALREWWIESLAGAAAGLALFALAGLGITRALARWLDVPSRGHGAGFPIRKRWHYLVPVVDRLVPTLEPYSSAAVPKGRRYLRLAWNFFAHLPASLVVAWIGVLASLSVEKIPLPLLGSEDLLIVTGGCLLLAGALCVAWAEKNLYSEMVYQYNTMSTLFGNARIRLAWEIARLESLEAESGGSFEEALDRVRDFLFDLGKEALDENAEWLILHRARPLEPVMAG